MKHYDDFYNEAQQYPEILRRYEENGEIFTDPNFIPTNKAKEAKVEFDDEKHTWQRIDKFYKAPLFKKKCITENAIQQGELGTCYFIASLSRIARQPELVELLFDTRTRNQIKNDTIENKDSINLKCGAVIVYFHVFGRRTPVLIDTLIPFQRGTRVPRFSHPSDINYSPWFCLVEKAYAKLHGSYSAIISGKLSQAIYHLFGYYPCYKNIDEILQKRKDKIKIKNKKESKKSISPNSTSKADDNFDENEYLFSLLMKWQYQNAVLGADIMLDKLRKGVTEDDLKDNGLVPSHAYLIVKVRREEGKNFICLRNPWGNHEWLGDWSDTSLLWTSKLKRALGVHRGNNGTFWMIADDFFRYFSSFDIAKPVDPEYHNKSIMSKLLPCEYDGYEILSKEAELSKHQTFVFKLKNVLVKTKDYNENQNPTNSIPVVDDLKVYITIEKRSPFVSKSENNSEDEQDPKYQVFTFYSDGQKIGDKIPGSYSGIRTNCGFYRFTIHIRKNTPFVIVFQRNDKRDYTEECYVRFSCKYDFDLFDYDKPEQLSKEDEKIGVLFDNESKRYSNISRKIINKEILGQELRGYENIDISESNATFYTDLKLNPDSETSSGFYEYSISDDSYSTRNSVRRNQKNLTSLLNDAKKQIQESRNELSLALSETIQQTYETKNKISTLLSDTKDQVQEAKDEIASFLDDAKKQTQETKDELSTFLEDSRFQTQESRDDRTRFNDLKYNTSETQNSTQAKNKTSSLLDDNLEQLQKARDGNAPFFDDSKNQSTKDELEILTEDSRLQTQDSRNYKTRLNDTKYNTSEIQQSSQTNNKPSSLLNDNIDNLLGTKEELSILTEDSRLQTQESRNNKMQLNDVKYNTSETQPSSQTKNKTSSLLDDNLEQLQKARDGNAPFFDDSKNQSTKDELEILTEDSRLQTQDSRNYKARLNDTKYNTSEIQQSSQTNNKPSSLLNDNIDNLLGTKEELSILTEDSRLQTQESRNNKMQLNDVKYNTSETQQSTQSKNKPPSINDNIEGLLGGKEILSILPEDSRLQTQESRNDKMRLNDVKYNTSEAQQSTRSKGSNGSNNQKQPLQIDVNSSFDNLNNAFNNALQQQQQSKSITQDPTKQLPIDHLLKKAEENDPAALFNLGLMYTKGQNVEKDQRKGVDFYERSAKLGNSKAQYNLGLLYNDGEGVPQDKKRALDLFEQSANNGNSYAQTKLGDMYSNGDYVEKDYQKAIDYYNRAVSQNDAEAQVNLGIMYDQGKGVNVDKKKAYELYNQSAKNGNPNALFNLGCMNETGVEGLIPKDIQKAADYYQQAADKGVTQAMLNLGLLNLKGDENYPSDWNKAAQLFQKGANSNDPNAMLNLGLMYLNGQIPPGADKRKAAELFKKASDMNNASAQFNLGLLYSKGDGVEKNPSKAVEYYEKAADKGISKATFNLGVLLFRGAEGVPQNKAKAAELFEKVSDKNNKAMFNLAVMHENGDGVEPDINKALYYYEKAAELNNKDALLNLGCIYEEGLEGVKPNKEKAFKLYEKASQLGSDKASTNLGLMYLKGEVCTADKEKAKEYFKKAADQGNPQAQLNYGILLEESGDLSDQQRAFDYYRSAADKGSPEALLILARKSMQDGNVPNALKYYEMAADKGNQQAQLELGQIYLNGDDVEKDLDKAEDLLLKAADKNKLSEAYQCLGNLYAQKGQTEKSLQYVTQLNQVNASDSISEDFKPKPSDNIDHEFEKVYLSVENRIKNLHNKIGHKPYSNVNSTLNELDNQLFDNYLSNKISEFDKKNQTLREVTLESTDTISKYENKMQNHSALPPLYKNDSDQQLLADEEDEDSEMNDEISTLKQEVQLLESQLNRIEISIKEEANRNSTKTKIQSPKDMSTSEILRRYCLPPRVKRNRIWNLKKKAEEGDAHSQYLLGACYATGEEVPQDREKALQLYISAANKGEVEAQYAAACCYFYGKGTIVNKKEAVKLFSLAAEHGHPKAQFAMGHFYEFGKSPIEKNYDKAIEWYRKAANQGHGAAIQRLSNESS